VDGVVVGDRAAGVRSRTAGDVGSQRSGHRRDSTHGGHRAPARSDVQ